MSKQLNNHSGKGYFLAQGQQSIEEYLRDHTQGELAIVAGMYKSGQPNAGAVSNILKDLCWGPFAGMEPGEKKPRSSKKVRGCLPKKVEIQLIKLLDLEDSPNFGDYLKALEVKADFYINAMDSIGGQESDGGKSFSEWIASNREIQAAEKLAAETPAYLRERIAMLEALLAENGIDIP